ncbi:hypothetical protein GCM10010271_32570 [Streptomyces kurssanovii]|nr:hypothetical protein GCM10010271_32570 [Streptomyces kurssanovii]
MRPNQLLTAPTGAVRIARACPRYVDPRSPTLPRTGGVYDVKSFSSRQVMSAGAWRERAAEATEDGVREA